MDTRSPADPGERPDGERNELENFVAKPAAHFRDAGKGPPVVCLHSSASSSGQWRSLMDRLFDRFHVIAADLYGYGESPAWPEDRAMYLDDQITLLEPVFDAAGESFHLIGHSFGGAIALKAALEYPGRVRSLAVFEPVLFSVLVANDPTSPAVREILAARDETIRSVNLGDLDASAKRFTDYWVGPGAWAATPEARRPAIAEAMRMVKPEWHAVFSEPTPLAAFTALDVPTLLLTGTESTLSAREISRLLAGVLPRVSVEEIDGVGHMAPVTHPEKINPLIERFLIQVSAG
ncbi:MAG: alpha/beta fold hydrolase [Rubrobacteraceae bacterium]